jgi:hypothetical protein
MDKKEVLRYMRTKITVEDEELDALINKVIKEVENTVAPKRIYRIFDCSVGDDCVRIGGFEFKSSRFAENMRGCKRAVCLAATLGTQGDMLLRKYSSQGALLIITQAVLAAKIEEICDDFQQNIERENGFKTRRRYSPGYFDLDITEQKKIFKLMEITKRCGIMLSDSCQMIPTKSVTAFAGIEQ